jgi:chemotaxis signal transduction protein
MRTVVRFDTSEGRYAVAVEHTREVRPASGLVQLPAARAGVVGVLPDDDGTLTVVSSLGEGRDHVLVLDTGERAFGLLVQEVAGVVAVEEATIGPPPAGQAGPLVIGTIPDADGLVM